MISIKTLSKLAQLRHEGVMLVRTDASSHSRMPHLADLRAEKEVQ